jgi:hypothetical protein
MNSQKPRSYGDSEEKYKEALSNLVDEALLEISRMKPPVIQFCGPISTGGFGNVTENLEYLNSVIQASINGGMSVFNQVSYERRLDQTLKDHHEYDYPLLDFFYSPILTSMKISGLVFLPLWETSVGSKWEHDIGQSLHLPILYLENMLVSEIEDFYKSLHL